MGKIYMIMGKSSSGKDHIYSFLLENESTCLRPLVLYTTRPKRAGEEDGREYYFTDEEHLKELREKGRIIEERAYDTVFGVWHYFTADEGQIDLEKEDYLTIGTPQSYGKMKAYFGEENVCPLYIEVADEIRLLRAIAREKEQEKPSYKELCRRFLADEEDFKEETLLQAGISRRFQNNKRLEECIDEIKKFVEENRKLS